MKQTENCTGRGCDTHRLHQKESSMRKYQRGLHDDEEPEPAHKGNR